MPTLHRAYSLLTLKAIDEDTRVITGIATTPTPDRMGDIVDPDGAEFQLPIPLLWQHNSREPIGEVFEARVSSAGIEIKARIARIDEPGKLKDRLDEAWQSIKAKLVRGLSIGFSELEAARIKDTYSFHYLKWLWLELSAVTIPANADATIQTVKSCDIGLAASGTRARVVSVHSSGAADTPRVVKTTRPSRIMKTYTEQISTFEATRQTKNAEIDAIMATALEAGVTLDADQKVKHDELVGDVTEIDDHLVRLRAAETRNKAAAKPIKGATEEEARSSRDPHQVITVKSPLLPGIKFARYAMCLASADGNKMQALEIAKERYPDDTDIHTVLKSAVAAGTTIDATWAGPLVQYQNFAGDFIEFLRPASIIGKFGSNGIPALRSVPFNVRIPAQTSGGSASWVGQGAPKPLTKFDFTTITMLWAKLAAISVLTQELVRHSTPSAELLTRDTLANAINGKMDTDFVDPAKAAVANVSPASITNLITPTVATGATAAAFRTDFSSLMAGFAAADLTPDTGVFIMSSTRALQLSLMLNALGQPEFPNLTMKGGTLLGFPVIVSNYVDVGSSPSTDLIVFVNASDIYLADDGQVVIDVSREASLQMDDAPSNNAATGTGQVSVSLWQTNSIGIRAERIINWQRRRDAAVAYISNAAYTA